MDGWLIDRAGVWMGGWVDGWIGGWEDGWVGVGWEGVWKLVGGVNGGPLGQMMVPHRGNARGFMDHLRPCGPSFRPPQGPDVRLPKIVTLLGGDAAPGAVIGPLTIPDAQPKQVHD